jgi:hypothetical protein
MTGHSGHTASALTGSLAGASFRFETDAGDLAHYARIHLAPLRSEPRTALAVDSRLRWHEGQPPRDRLGQFPLLAEMERVDRDLYLAPGRLHWFRIDDLRDLYLRLTWQDDRLTVEGDFYFRLANDRHRDRAKRLIYRRRTAALRRRRFTTLLSYLVYYPCWWWLEHTQDRHPIHAAGVLAGDRVILLGGASGVGKSTLAVALALQPGARLLSDSFVLHRGRDVSAVPEPVLLDTWSRRWLGDRAEELQPIDWRYCLNRQGYQLPPQRLATGGPAALLLFPRRAPRNYVRRITPEHAHQRLSAVDLIINDLRRYWAFGAIMEQLVPGRLVLRRESALARLTAQLPCYEIGLTAEISCAAAVESVTELLRDEPARAVSAHS